MNIVTIIILIIITIVYFSLVIMGNKQNKRNHRNSHRHVFKKRKSNYKHNSNLSVTKAKSHAGTSSSAVPMETESTSAENHQTLVTSEIIKGSRIINIEQLYHHISDITMHAAKCGSEMKLIGETREGLASIIVCSCVSCGHNIHLQTSEKVVGPKGYKCWQCNLAAVWGQVSSGGGHTPLMETMSVLGIPVMAKKKVIP